MPDAHDLAKLARRQAREQDALQESIENALAIAAQAPHTIEQLRIYSTTVEELPNGHKTLVIVRPHGLQLRLEMRPQLCRNLARELAKEPAANGADSSPDPDA